MIMKKRFFVFAVLVGFLAGCSGTKVERLQVERVVDLSGRWNDSDAQMVSKEMIANCLSAAWLSNFLKEEGHEPVVIVGTVDNNSSEHINSAVFVKSLESNLISSGKVKFVASKFERPEVRAERKDQHEEGYTDPKTIKQLRKEIGADFMLRGSINTVTDNASGKYVILYQVNLELIDLTTNEVKWLEQTELKKLVSKSKYSL